jgi:hypothetical protein
VAKKKQKPKKFSVVKAVKANARERVGQPRPERVIEDERPKDTRKAKHPKTLAQMISVE